MGKSTISMAIFNSYVSHYQRVTLFTRLVSLGIPLFKVLDDNFMTNIDVPSRWRPAMEGAQILAEKMEKRVLRISLERMRTGGVSVTQLARPQLWHATAQLGPYFWPWIKEVGPRNFIKFRLQKAGPGLSKNPKIIWRNNQRGGFLEVLCGFVELSSSVSTQFSTLFFRSAAGSYWWNDFFPCNPCWLWEPAMSWKVWRVVRRSWVARWWERWTEPSGCPASSQAGQMVVGLW